MYFLKDYWYENLRKLKLSFKNVDKDPKEKCKRCSGNDLWCLIFDLLEVREKEKKEGWKVSKKKGKVIPRGRKDTCLIKMTHWEPARLMKTSHPWVNICENFSVSKE